MSQTKELRLRLGDLPKSPQFLRGRGYELTCSTQMLFFLHSSEEGNSFLLLAKVTRMPPGSGCISTLILLPQVVPPLGASSSSLHLPPPKAEHQELPGTKAASTGMIRGPVQEWGQHGPLH